jgi:hypothetical protein
MAQLTLASVRTWLISTAGTLSGLSEETGDSMLEVDCVFDGETEFPLSPYEPKHEREE